MSILSEEKVAAIRAAHPDKPKRAKHTAEEKREAGRLRKQRQRERYKNEATEELDREAARELDDLEKFWSRNRSAANPNELARLEARQINVFALERAIDAVLNGGEVPPGLADEVKADVAANGTINMEAAKGTFWTSEWSMRRIEETFDHVTYIYCSLGIRAAITKWRVHQLNARLELKEAAA